MTVINTNIAASVTANAMRSNQRVMENTMERLSTGMRINSASDDAAGLGIGSKMESEIRGLSQAVRNANDGISMIQTADGAASEINNMFQRMRELAVQAQNGTNGTNDLTNLNKEFNSLATEIDRVATATTFNGENLLNGVTAKSLNIGSEQGDDLSVAFKDFNIGDGNAAATVAKFDLNITVGELNGITAGSALQITDSLGRNITVTDADINTVRNGGDLQDATLAELKTAIDTELGVNTGFGDAADGTDGGFTTAVNGEDGIRFTQATAGVGTISSLSAVTADGAIGTGVSSTIASTSVSVNQAYSASAGVYGADLSTYATNTSIAQTAGTIDAIDTAIQGISAARADFGAAINTLEYSIDNLQNAVANTSAARSAVMDADYASETTELARTQIIAQASTAMLSQANQQAQSVLALLK